MPHGKLTSPDLPSVAIVQSVTVVEYAQSVASAIIAVVEPIGEIWSDAHVTRWASVIGVTTLVAANIVRLYQVLALSQTPLATDASAPVSMRAMMIFDADMVLVGAVRRRMRRWIEQMYRKEGPRFSIRDPGGKIPDLVRFVRVRVNVTSDLKRFREIRLFPLVLVTAAAAARE